MRLILKYHNTRVYRLKTVTISASRNFHRGTFGAWNFVREYFSALFFLSFDKGVCEIGTFKIYDSLLGEHYFRIQGLLRDSIR